MFGGKADKCLLVLPEVAVTSIAWLSREYLGIFFAQKEAVCINTLTFCSILIINSNRTEWSPVRSVIIRVIKKIGRVRSGSSIC